MRAGSEVRMRHVRPEVLVSKPNGRSRLTSLPSAMRSGFILTALGYRGALAQQGIQYLRCVVSDLRYPTPRRNTNGRALAYFLR